MWLRLKNFYYNVDKVLQKDKKNHIPTCMKNRIHFSIVQSLKQIYKIIL